MKNKDIQFSTGVRELSPVKLNLAVNKWWHSTPGASWNKLSDAMGIVRGGKKLTGARLKLIVEGGKKVEMARRAMFALCVALQVREEEISESLD